MKKLLIKSLIALLITALIMFGGMLFLYVGFKYPRITLVAIPSVFIFLIAYDRLEDFDKKD